MMTIIVTIFVAKAIYRRFWSFSYVSVPPFDAAQR